MLYLHLLTLSGHVDKFVIGYSNYSFANDRYSPLSFFPFEREILSYSESMVFVYVDFHSTPLSASRYRNGTAWRREATARNRLIDGVRSLDPGPNDLVLLCDVDEIVTREAVRLIKRRPPVHYYNVRGLLFHYTFRWEVGEWERPLVIRYGAIDAPLDDYKFAPFVFALPGVLHFHCSFCAPNISEVLWKLRSFSHMEYSEGRFQDPNYVYARIACGYGLLPTRWKMPERLKLVEFRKEKIWMPEDGRFDFLKRRIGFQDLSEFSLNVSAIRKYMPKKCPLKKDPDLGVGVIE
jgi:hypothetical protein